MVDACFENRPRLERLGESTLVVDTAGAFVSKRHGEKGVASLSIDAFRTVSLYVSVKGVFQVKEFPFRGDVVPAT